MIATIPASVKGIQITLSAALQLHLRVVSATMTWHKLVMDNFITEFMTERNEHT
jgi:hypothetical protein